MTRTHLRVPRWVFFVYLLGMGAGFFFEPFGVLTISWLVWHQRARVQATINKAINFVMNWQPVDYPVFAWLPLILIAFATFANGGVPLLDDFARHVHAYRHNFDYSKQYLYTDVLDNVHFSAWIGFEWLTGHLHAAILHGLNSLATQTAVVDKNAWALILTHHIVVGLAFGLFGWIFIPVFRKIFRDHPLTHAMTGLALVLILATGIGIRILQARPEIFLMLAMFSVWRLPPRVVVILLMALQPLYWLGWLYSAGVLLITNWRWHQKAVAIALILGSYALFWHYYCGLEPVKDFFMLVHNALKTRLIHAGENLPILEYAFSFIGPLCMVLVVMAFYRWDKSRLQPKEHLSILMLMTLWILFNQIRYIVYCIPCLVYLWANQSKLKEEFLAKNDEGKNHFLKEKTYILVVYAFAMVVCLKALPINGFVSSIPLFNTLPANAKVLTFFNISTFVLPALYPEIKIAPAMEVGFSNRPLQEFMKERWDARGDRFATLDCKWLQKLNAFTHIVDLSTAQTMPGQTPPCVKLQETYGGWRLWQVIPAATSATPVSMEVTK